MRRGRAAATIDSVETYLGAHNPRHSQNTVASELLSESYCVYKLLSMKRDMHHYTQIRGKSLIVLIQGYSCARRAIFEPDPSIKALGRIRRVEDDVSHSMSPAST